MTAEKRFWAKVEKTGGCWLWTGCATTNGYGFFYLDGRMVKAHRFAYELLVGPIPEGLELDHVRERGCRHRHCVNPAHLEPVTHKENVRRGLSPGGLNARKSCCSRGHELTPANTKVDSKGHRHCRTCQNATNSRYMARRRRTGQEADPSSSCEGDCVMFHGEQMFEISPVVAQVIRRGQQAFLWICPQIHRVTHRIGQRFQQGYTPSMSQGAAGSINGMRRITLNPAAQRTEIAKRLRAIGALADRLDHGAEASYVLDLAKAILASGDQIEPEPGPT